MRARILAASAAALLSTLVAGDAAARPIVPDPGGEQSLQQLLDAHTTGPGIDVVADQATPTPLFSGPSRAVSVTLIEEIAGFADRNQLGVYRLGEPSVSALLFQGPDGPGTSASLDFVGDDLFVNGSLALAGFGQSFGFYIATGGGELFYTEDVFNPGGLPQALVFDGDEQSAIDGIPLAFDSRVVAFEDLRFDSGDRDFQDLVLVAEGVRSQYSPIPEPATLALLGVALAALSLRRRP